MYYLEKMDYDYYNIFNAIKKYGQKYNIRGLKCVECRPVSFEIEESRNTIYSGKSRKLNYPFLAVETLSYLIGWHNEQHAELLCMVNKNISQFMNPETKRFDGAYGKSFHKHFPRVLQQLERDRYTRQAVLNIWNDQTEIDSLDIPCTISMQFLVENKFEQDALITIVNMRSNDINWGFPYDIPAFCTIHNFVADILEIYSGNYYHNTGSLHYYENKQPNFKNYEEEEFYNCSFQLPKLILEEFYCGEDNSVFVKYNNIRMIIYTYLDMLHFHLKNGYDIKEYKLHDSLKDNSYMKFWHKLITFDKDKY